jgi:hypothetical protein
MVCAGGRSGAFDKLVDGGVINVEVHERVGKDLAALVGVGSAELESGGGAAAHSGVKSVETVGTQDDHDGQAGPGEAVDSGQERVDSGAIFVVHLGGLAGLDEGIGLVDHEDLDGLDGASSGPGLLALATQMVEGVTDEAGHLADETASAGGKLEPVEEDGEVERT